MPPPVPHWPLFPCRRWGGRRPRPGRQASAPLAPARPSPPLHHLPSEQRPPSLPPQRPAHVLPYGASEPAPQSPGSRLGGSAPPPPDPRGPRPSGAPPPATPLAWPALTLSRGSSWPFAAVGNGPSLWGGTCRPSSTHTWKLRCPSPVCGEPPEPTRGGPVSHGSLLPPDGWKAGDGGSSGFSFIGLCGPQPPPPQGVGGTLIFLGSPTGGVRCPWC